MFKLVISRFRIVPLLAVGSVFVFLACRLTQSEKVEQTISFNKFYDSLAQFDSVQITMKDTSGHTIDNIYHGKVDTISEIMDLPAPHWDGGLVIVSILGYRAGEIVYHMDRKFDGATNKSIDTTYVILPNTSLSIVSPDLQLTEGDSVPYPVVTVTPVGLKDKTISWTSSQPAIVTNTGNGLKATLRGTALLTGTLVSNPSKTTTIHVTVLPNPAIPDSLSITPDSLALAAGGASGKVFSKVRPSSADASVLWGLLDSSIAHVTPGGIVQGLKQGSTRLWAKSVRKPSLVDTIPVIVSGPIPVDRIQFQNDSLDLYIGGSSESLWVEVLPPKANPNMEFQILDPALVTLVDGKAKAIEKGTTLIIARSVENPEKSDTLKVNVFVSQKIDSVRANPDSLKLYTGGAIGTLSGSVYPATSLQTLKWRTLNAAIAVVNPAGIVSAIAPGKTQIIVVSRVDSTKQDTIPVTVKADFPVVAVGRDTVVSVGANLAFRPVVTQEFGKVVQFKWDLDGDGAWDESSDSIKPVSHLYDKAGDFAVSFYVKDTEGNETIVVKKIKAVQGPAVLILSPKDSSYTNVFLIDVSWSVNGKIQDSLVKQSLKLGANTVIRSARDEAGNLFSSSIFIFVDTMPPAKPLVHGPVQAATKTPTWTWSTGGSGGAGIFKTWMETEDPAQAKEIRDTTFTPPIELTEAVHTLFVVERDMAGNWSQSGRFSIKVDLTGPTAPKVVVTPSSPTNNRKPKWTWTSGGGGGIGAYRFKLDDANLATGTTDFTDTSYAPATNLSNGFHSLYVQEKDSAGNWSISGISSVVIDTIPPNTPSVTSASPSPTNNSQPTWNWTSVGSGGRGFYRFKVGDTLWATGGSQGAQITFQPSTGLAEGSHTLYVEEQDSAGNWSLSGKSMVVVDVTKPNTPVFNGTQVSPTNTSTPTWSWASGGGGDKKWFRFKLDDSTLNLNAQEGGGTIYTPATPGLAEGLHTVYVQEQDSAGNWSSVASKQVVIDLTPPNSPKVSSTSFNTTNVRPQWHWSSGGNAGNGQYRYKIDDPSGIAGGPVGTDTTYTPSVDFAVGSMHTLYVQEQDAVGNWSSSGTFTVRIHGQSGFSAGGSGIMFRTTNSGTSWDSVYSGTSTIIRSIYFPDGLVGFAVGDGGAVIKTTNGGGTWSKVPSSPSINMTSVFFNDQATGYVVGQSGSILKTSNSGVSWQTLSSGTTETLNSVRFLDSQTGFSAGNNGTILKTTNGGAAWVPVSSGTIQNLQSLFFTDAVTGYACGDNGTLLKTINGGGTWSPLISNSVQSLQSVFFIDKKIGYASGKTGRTMLKTLNGGDTWQEVLVETSTGTHPVSLNSIYFTDSLIGYASGKGGAIYATINGGTTWTSSAANVIVGGTSLVEPELFSIFFP